MKKPNAKASSDSDKKSCSLNFPWIREMERYADLNSNDELREFLLLEEILKETSHFNSRCNNTRNLEESKIEDAMGSHVKVSTNLLFGVEIILYLLRKYVYCSVLFSMDRCLFHIPFSWSLLLSFLRVFIVWIGRCFVCLPSPCVISFNFTLQLLDIDEV